MSALRNNNVGVAFTRLDKLFVHRLEYAPITFNNGFYGSSALYYVALDNANQSVVGICIYENAQVHLFAQRCVAEGKNTFYNNHLLGLNMNRFRLAGTRQVRIDGLFNGFSVLQARKMRRQQGPIEGIRMVKVNVLTLLYRDMTAVFVIRVLGDDNYLSFRKAFNEFSDYRCFTRAGTTRNADNKHKRNIVFKSCTKVLKIFHICKKKDKFIEKSTIYLHNWEKNRNFALKYKSMLIELNHINKHFGAQQVLRDVCLRIEAGEVVGLLGPNGAGKSTLMKILLGLWRADSGEVKAPLSHGYLPEQNPLYEEMYVREYLSFMCRIEGAQDSVVDELMERVGLAREAHKKIRQLSKGYRQRVGLAQAMIGEPELIILDEPTTGLDPNQLDEVRVLIKSLAARKEGERGRVVILSTHILQEVKEMCSRVVILDRGEIKVDKPMAEIADLESLFRQVTV